jgi:hypothetical protein
MVILNQFFIEELSREPAFCFTSDIDWAPESMIENTLKLFSKNNIALTPFLTGYSCAIKKAYTGRKAQYVGIHPNFLSNSTQGRSADEIVSNLCNIWPKAECFRSHSFFDNSLIAKKFYEKGFKYDSNLCLNLQSGIVPLKHSSGIIRFPVFLEDDSHIAEGFKGSVSDIVDIIKTPGLKIFNFHPIHICLNTPNMKYYEKIKKVVNGKNWGNFIYNGSGARTFLMELLRHIKGHPGLGAFYLKDLYLLATRPLNEKSQRTISYDKFSNKQRTETIRAIYNSRDVKNIYAT